MLDTLGEAERGCAASPPPEVVAHIARMVADAGQRLLDARRGRPLSRPASRLGPVGASVDRPRFALRCSVLNGIDPAAIFIAFVVLVFSLTVHEAAHAWTADRLGDPTARLQGRVSLNPMVHIDPIGTVLFPLIGMISGRRLAAPRLGQAGTGQRPRACSARGAT